MNYLILSWLLLVFPPSTIANAFDRRNKPHVTTIPSQPVVGDIIANFESKKHRLDGPQLSAINSTSFDWWYFDVVAPDLKSSLVVVFFTALDSGFPFLLPDTNPDVISIFYSLPDGTGDTIWLSASEAIVTTTKDGSSGQYVGAGASWTGTPNLNHYEININAPDHGIVGTFDLKSSAPAHYPCGPAGKSQNMIVAPHIGWSNALPDAVGKVDFQIGGKHLKFKGVAYHDKNWSDQPFGDNVASWYWGHGRLGPYSIVWFDTLALNGTEYVSAYAAKDNSIIASSCLGSSVKVRPVNSQYPPSLLTDDPAAFTVLLDLGTDGVLNATVTIVETIADAGPAYKRWTGSMTGRVANGTVLTGGVALLEQFKMVV